MEGGRITISGSLINLDAGIVMALTIRCDTLIWQEACRRVMRGYVTGGHALWTMASPAG